MTGIRFSLPLTGPLGEANAERRRRLNDEARAWQRECTAVRVFGLLG